MQASICPICKNLDGYECHSLASAYDAQAFDCSVCGRFAITPKLALEFLDHEHPKVTRQLLAVMSHNSKSANRRGAKQLWKTYDVEALIESGCRLPSPSQQVTNALRYIGDAVLESGEPLADLPPDFRSTIGAMSRDAADRLVMQMKEAGLIDAISAGEMGRSHYAMEIEPTLSGWAQFERERVGLVAGRYGFIAMKFGDPVLDPFVSTVVKPAVTSIGYELIDLRDVAQAGIIDNVLREQIRDAAFVLVDLTHANNGAYWEAGYAEGLGKPVLYLCERDVFNAKSTHFDTNHCTTVLWQADAPANFTAELVATLRRSLGLFN